MNKTDQVLTRRELSVSQDREAMNRKIKYGW